MLLSCATEGEGCFGSSHEVAFDYMQKHNITDETCAIYEAKGYN